jgi:hypothetical protein
MEDEWVLVGFSPQLHEDYLFMFTMERVMLVAKALDTGGWDSGFRALGFGGYVTSGWM